MDILTSQGCTVLQWGRLSDRIGRKPVLLIGLSGSCIAMLSFGLSTTYPRLLVSRGMAGLLNGNIGVAKTAIAEMTDDSNRPVAIAMFPAAWFVGCTFGQHQISELSWCSHAFI